MSYCVFALGIMAADMTTWLYDVFCDSGTEQLQGQDRGGGLIRLEE